MDSSESETEPSPDKSVKESKLTHALICDLNLSPDSLVPVHTAFIDNFLPKHKEDFLRNQKYKLWMDAENGKFRYVYVLLLGSKYI